MADFNVNLKTRTVQTDGGAPQALTQLRDSVYVLYTTPGNDVVQVTSGENLYLEALKKILPTGSPEPAEASRRLFGNKADPVTLCLFNPGGTDTVTPDTPPAIRSVKEHAANFKNFAAYGDQVHLLGEWQIQVAPTLKNTNILYAPPTEFRPEAGPLVPQEEGVFKNPQNSVTIRPSTESEKMECFPRNT